MLLPAVMAMHVVMKLFGIKASYQGDTTKKCGATEQTFQILNIWKEIWPPPPRTDFAIRSPSTNGSRNQSLSKPDHPTSGKVNFQKSLMFLMKNSVENSVLGALNWLKLRCSPKLMFFNKFQKVKTLNFFEIVLMISEILKVRFLIMQNLQNITRAFLLEGTYNF